MPKQCGKHVNSLGKASRKTRGYLSTNMRTDDQSRVRTHVKLSLLHILFPSFTQQPSTLFSLPLPLVEHYFYPVSTAPITTITKEKFKER